MSTDLKLDRVQLRNFRCFADCTIDLHENLTVLVAENGRGKTALLDGIGIALGTFVDGVTGAIQSHGFERSDIRLVTSEGGVMKPTLPTEFRADGLIQGAKIHWTRSLQKDSGTARASMKDCKDILAASARLRETALATLADGNRGTNLPIVAFYGTGRLWSEHRLSRGKQNPSIDVQSRFSGYSNCLSPSSSFKEVVSWYERKMAEIKDAAFASQLSVNLGLVEAIRTAVRTVLEPTGWQELNWGGAEMVVKHQDGRELPLSALSDGVQNMIALVADLAHRCARLNPHLREAAARDTAGVVLVDEIDMHLHPRWQQLVVDSIRSAFPAVQFIMSTHSPHVLSTVDYESIRIIRVDSGNALLSVPQFQTRGVESADVLSRVMGVDPIPQIDPALWLTNYKAMIQTGQHETNEGKELFARIISHFGEHHPVLEEIWTLQRLQEFRRISGLPRHTDS